VGRQGTKPHLYCSILAKSIFSDYREMANSLEIKRDSLLVAVHKEYSFTTGGLGLKLSFLLLQTICEEK
jgi:hypothetical protein